MILNILKIRSISCYLLFFALVINFDLLALSKKVEENGKEEIFYKGMSCCKCFIHCSCFGQFLDEIPSRVFSLYLEAIKNCPHSSLFAIYNKRLTHSLMGDWEEAIVHVKMDQKLL